MKIYRLDWIITEKPLIGVRSVWPLAGTVSPVWAHQVLVCNEKIMKMAILSLERVLGYLLFRLIIIWNISKPV